MTEAAYVYVNGSERPLMEDGRLFLEFQTGSPELALFDGRHVPPKPIELERESSGGYVTKRRLLPCSYYLLMFYAPENKTFYPIPVEQKCFYVFDLPHRTSSTDLGVNFETISPIEEASVCPAGTRICDGRGWVVFINEYQYSQIYPTMTFGPKNQFIRIEFSDIRLFEGTEPNDRTKARYTAAHGPHLSPPPPGHPSPSRMIPHSMADPRSGPSMMARQPHMGKSQAPSSALEAPAPIDASLGSGRDVKYCIAQVSADEATKIAETGAYFPAPKGASALFALARECSTLVVIFITDRTAINGSAELVLEPNHKPGSGFGLRWIVRNVWIDSRSLAAIPQLPPIFSLETGHPLHPNVGAAVCKTIEQFRGNSRGNSHGGQHHHLHHHQHHQNSSSGGNVAHSHHNVVLLNNGTTGGNTNSSNGGGGHHAIGANNAGNANTSGPNSNNTSGINSSGGGAGGSSMTGGGPPSQYRQRGGQGSGYPSSGGRGGGGSGYGGRGGMGGPSGNGNYRGAGRGKRTYNPHPKDSERF